MIRNPKMHRFVQAAIAGLILALVPVRPAISLETESDARRIAGETAAPAQVAATAPADKPIADGNSPAGPEPATAAGDGNTTAEMPKTAQALDLSSLEQRLRETDAIGFFTKLALKDQIDDLLDTFRAYHQRSSDTALEQLRERYNLLLLKVQSLLQDRAPQLAYDIHTSREAIWDVLTNPKKFASLETEKGI
jgi:hypothetical protein